MFKLSALEPLLESNTKRGARSSHHQKPQKDRKPGDSPGKKATNNSPDRPLPYALSTQDWQAQAEQLTQGVNAPSYRSLAVYAQVKLTEALDKCDQASPPRLAEDDTVLPDRLRTAVCCQLLAELCGMCGAFAPVLRTIQQELVKAIYSDYYVSDSGRLHFCQVPYFTAVERLEGEKQHMLREKEVFRKTLLKRQDEIAHIEEHIGELTGALHSSQANASELEAKLHQAGQVEAQAKLEVAAAREELKRVRKEHLKLKDEWETLRALYDTVKAKPERIQARCDEQMAKMKEKVAKYKAEALAAQELAGSRAPQEELQAALDRCQAVLAPEPPPAPIQLVIFRRGSDPGGSGAQAGRQVDCAESLGLEPHVPRYLRCSQDVAISRLSLQQAEQRTHASTSAPISLFLQVLSGRLPEAAHRDFERMLGCVAEVLLLLDGSVKEGVETTVAMPDLEHTLQTLFPHKSREQLQQLLPGGDADGQVDVSSLMPLARATTSWPYTPGGN
ncbi:hypothetical protein WJX72_002526 [[Myrmecia] bisecta]|uniref:Translin-associated factor X-interacting protein 1 N-terminal domain-containing protein n=1 Tax=[Myrmecia] bisecta TaxID=41462 RepID=A0AAW1QPJ2_9CHLO